MPNSLFRLPTRLYNDRPDGRGEEDSLSWLHRFRAKKYFYRMVLVFFIVSFLPSFLLSILYYDKASGIITDRLEQANYARLKQIEVSVDIVMDHIIGMAEQMAADNLFSDYNAFPMKRSFRSFRDHDDAIKVRRYYDYLELRRRIYEELEIRSITGGYIHSLYYYDRSEREIFPSGGIPGDVDRFFDREWMVHLEDGGILPHIMEPRNILIPAANQHLQVLTLIYPTFDYNGFFIFNIDTAALYNVIDSRLTGKEPFHFFVLSRQGSPILNASADKGLALALAGLTEQSRTSQGEIILLDRAWRINSFSSRYLDWTYVSLLTGESYISELRRLQFSILFLTGGIMLGVVILMLLAGRFLYEPVKRLLETLNLEKDNRPRDPEEGELIQVLHYVERARDEKEILERRLNRSFPASREMFLQGLLEGRTALGNDPEEDLKFFGINLQPLNLRVLLVDLAFGDEEENDASDPGIDETVVSVLREFPGESVMAGKKRWGHIINDTDPKASILALAEEIQSEIARQRGQPPTLGISRKCPSLELLKQALEEAEEALNYRLLFGTGQVIPFEKIRSVTGWEIKPHQEKRESFQSALSRGETEKAICLVEDLVDEIHKNRYSLSLREARHLFGEILSTILTLRSGGINFKTEWSEEDFYLTLFNLKNLEEVRMWLRDQTEEAATLVAFLKKEQNSSYIERVKTKLKTDYARAVNLNTVAEDMKLNPFYLSRLFKESEGISFTEYLTNLRLVKAKTLLKESDLSIKEIGLKVGYDRSNYFIRVFKRNTGFTPGEYRHAVIEEKIL